MEKQVIINFLTEHWDEFSALLSAARDGSVDLVDSTHFPADVYEFVKMLSTLSASDSTNTPCKAFDTEHKAHRSTSEYRCTGSEGKGLLKKAQHLRECTAPTCEKAPSITVKDGLFVVNRQKSDEKLNDSFKKLVDSVLRSEGV